jgi:TolB-like protein
MRRRELEIPRCGTPVGISAYTLSSAGFFSTLVSMQPAPIADDPRTAAFHRAIADRYIVEREIGRGGMSRIYLAHDIRHQRAVAIKVLPPDIATADGRRLFLREIQIAARLNHPNILPLHDSGEAAGRLFFVMPFVEGKTLRDLLNERGALTIANALPIIRTIADALDYAHASHVVHRDIKPENILIVAGHPALADFGIAQAMHVVQDESRGAARSIVGTRAYMSPEQKDGLPVDERADLYAFGVVIREMLAGPNAQSRLPRRVQRIIDRALAQDPAERFSSAAQLARAIERADRASERIAWFVAPPIVLAFAAAVWVIARPAAPVVSLQPRRVVIAQFENASKRPELNYVGSMVADWVTEGLQRTGFVDVVPTLTSLSASRFAAEQRDPVHALAAETNAAIVVTGSIYVQASEIQVQVQVTDALNNKLLGAIGPIRGPLATPTVAIEGVRSRLMGLLSTTFDSRLAASIEVPLSPPTFDAYLDFSQGLEDYVATDFASAGSKFVRAFQRDTSFVTALLMASIARSNEASYAVADSLLDALAPNRSRLTPVDRAWFDYRRHLLAGDRAAALVSVRQLAAAAPGTKAVYNLAVEAMQNGALAEARSAIESLSPDRGPMRGWAPYWEARTRIDHLLGDRRAELRDAEDARRRFPTRIYSMSALVRALASGGRTSEVRRLIDASESMPADPAGITPADLALEAGLELLAHGKSSSDAAAVWKQGLAWLESRNSRTLDQRFTWARLAYALGRWREAEDSARSLAVQQPARPDLLGLSASAAAHLGDTATARRTLDLLSHFPRRYDIGIASVNAARVLAVLGQRDSALAMMRRSAGEGHEFDIWVHRDLDLAAGHRDSTLENAARPKPR